MQLSLNVSPSLLYCLLFITFCSETAIYCTDCAFYWQILAAVLLVLYAAWLMWGHIFMRRQAAIIALECMLNEQWLLTLRSTEIVTGLLTAANVVMSSYWVLRFVVASTNKTLICIVAKDAVSPQQYRRLVMIINTTI